MSSQDPIASSVLRFVQSGMNDGSADPSQADWHGVIKHVQSNTERHLAVFPMPLPLAPVTSAWTRVQKQTIGRYSQMPNRHHVPRARQYEA